MCCPTDEKHMTFTYSGTFQWKPFVFYFTNRQWRCTVCKVDVASFIVTIGKPSSATEITSLLLHLFCVSVWVSIMLNLKCVQTSANVSTIYLVWNVGRHCPLSFNDLVCETHEEKENINKRRRDCCLIVNHSSWSSLLVSFLCDSPGTQRRGESLLALDPPLSFI